MAGDQVRPLKLGDDAGFLLRGDITPAVTAPLVFVGHGLVLPQYGIDDLPVSTSMARSWCRSWPRTASVPGAAGAHFGSPAERWKVYKAAGAVGVVFIPNPHSPGSSLGTRRQDPSRAVHGAQGRRRPLLGLRLWVMLNPARFPLLLEGTGHHADELLALLKDGKPLPHFDLPLRLAATVDAKVSDIISENVVGVLAGIRSKLARRDSWC